jgi:hypothetical protein
MFSAKFIRRKYLKNRNIDPEFPYRNGGGGSSGCCGNGNRLLLYVDAFDLEALV